MHTSNLFFHPLQGQLAERLRSAVGPAARVLLQQRHRGGRGVPEVRAPLLVHARRAAGRVRRVRARRSHGRTIGVAVGDLGRALPRRRSSRCWPASRSCRPTIRRRCARRCRRQTAAIIVEPIQGEGGVRPICAGVRRGDRRRRAQRTGALLIADEVQSGLGRTGQPFYFPALGLTPDLVSVGKALGGGVPIGAALVADDGRGDDRRRRSRHHLRRQPARLPRRALRPRRARRRPARARRGDRARSSSAACARWSREHRHRRRGPRRRPDVGPRARPRRGAGRAGGARARRHRQPHGGGGGAAAAAATSSPKRRSTKALGASRCRARRTPVEVPMATLLILDHRRRAGRADSGDCAERHDDPPRDRRRRAGDPRADQRQPRRRAPAAADARGPDAPRRRASRGHGARRRRRLRRAGAAQPRRSPRCARWSVDASARGRGVGSRIVEELRRCARVQRRLRDAVRVHARRRRTSSAWASRSCRTRGCPRRSPPTASTCPQFRQCGQYAMALPLRGRSLRTRRPAAAVPAMPDGADRAAQAAPSRRAVASTRPASMDLRRCHSFVARRRHRAGAASAPPASTAASRPRRRARPDAARRRRPGQRRRRVFTTNLAAAAPVLVSREHLAATGGRARAIVVNSGCANACTGDAGLQAARARWRAETARAVGCAAEEVLVASTGVIGVSLDPRTVTHGIIAAARRAERRTAHADAARAIMTTDPFPKERAVAVDDRRRRRSAIGGMAKGSGMIEPMMATMLGFVTTDAAVPPALLQRALTEACDDTFNAITVDGECSTNDCVFAAGQRRQRRAHRRGRLRRVRRGAARASAASWRSASCAAARARPSWSPCTVTGAAHLRRRAAGGEGDRQLAAGEDRDPRRRSELGPAGRRRRPLPASRSIARRRAR